MQNNSSTKNKKSKAKTSNRSIPSALLWVSSSQNTLQMDLKNKGTTWEYYPRFPFAGEVVTGENRRELTKKKYLEVLAREPKNGEESLTPEQAMAYAKDWIRLNQKMYKQYLKGKQYFKFKGERMPVMTSERLQRFKEIAMDLKDKWENMTEEEKEKHLGSEIYFGDTIKKEEE